MKAHPHRRLMKDDLGSREIGLLLRAIDEAYDHSAWHGPNLRGSLRGFTATQAAWRPAPNRHNIWEIAVHAAYWKYTVRRRLTGGRRGSFAERGSNWFRRPASTPKSLSEKSWRHDLALLEQEHRLLRETVAATDSRGLYKRSGKGGRPPIAHILGIAFHDVYHAGQVQLLKRLQRSGAKR
jgi:hypothetical protein